MGSLTHTVGGTNNLVNFKSAARVPIDSLKVHFSPIQEGEGDPSPENVRPISGWDGIEQFYSGKNIGHVVGYSAGSTTSPSSSKKLNGAYGNTISTTNPEESVTITQTQWPESSNLSSYKNGYFAIVVDNLIFDNYYDISFKISNITNNPLNASLSNIKATDPLANSLKSPIVNNDTLIFKNIQFKQHTSVLSRKEFYVYYCGMSFTLSDFMVTPANTNDGIFEPYAPRRLVNWNQWLKPLTEENWQAYNSSKINVTFEDGIATSTWLTNNIGYSTSVITKVGILQKSKEIWYVSYMIKTSKNNSKWGVEFNGGIQSTPIDNLEANVWDRCSDQTIFWRGTRNYVYISNYKDSTDNDHIGMTAQVKSPIFINLTQMFGPGNEPTKEEFEEQCALNGIDLTSALPYDEGSVKEWKTNGTLLKNTITFPVLGKNKFNINASFAEPNNTTAATSTLRIFQPYTYCLGLDGSNYYNPSLITSFSNSNNTITFTSSHKNYGVAFSIPLLYGTYKLSYTGENISFKFIKYDSSGQIIYDGMTQTDNNTFSVGKNVAITTIIFMPVTANTPSTISNIQIEEGITTTEYEEFNPNHTVYGGYVDLANGELVQEWNKVDLGSLTWTLENSGDNYWFYSNGINNMEKINSTSVIANIISDRFKTVAASTIYTGVADDNSVGVNDGNPRKLRIKATTYQNNISTFAEDMQGVLLYYKMEEPIHYSLTPNQLSTFLNQNNFWSNTNDSTEVSYAIYDSEQIQSARKRILAAAPKIEEKNDSIATFNTDISAPLKECKVYFEPKQDLHGYDKPWIGGAGKNKLGFKIASNVPNGINRTINFTKNYIRIEAQDSASTNAIIVYSLSEDYLLSKNFPPGTYIFSIQNFETNIPNITKDKIFLGMEARRYDGDIITLSETYSSYIIVNYDSTIQWSAGSYMQFSLQIEEGTTVTNYEPYENICPIEGWEEIKTWKTNKNLIDLSASVLPPDNTAGGVTQKRKFTPGAWTRGVAQNNHWSSTNGNVTLYSDHIVVTSRSGYGAGFVLALPAGKTFSVIANVSIASYRAYAIYYKNDGTYIDSKSILYKGQWSTFTVPNDCVITIISFVTQNIDDYGLECTISNLQLESSPTSTNYEPYQGQTIPVTFPSGAGTVYGGYIDLIKKEIVVDYILLENTWGDWSLHGTQENTVRKYCEFNMDVYSSTEYLMVSRKSNIAKYSFSWIQMDEPHFYFSDNRRVYMWLPTNTDNSTVIQVLGHLIEPLHYTINPTTIKTLRGTNNIWSNANENIQIKYWTH